MEGKERTPEERAVAGAKAQRKLGGIMKGIAAKVKAQKVQAAQAPLFTKDLLLDGLKNDKFKRIAIVTGAGISVSAGIPDFRSPVSGLYDNLKEFDLPDQQAIYSPLAMFRLAFFREQPEPFYKLAKQFLDLDSVSPTVTHHFCKLLHDKGIVRHYLTQNIDNLESKVGFSTDQIQQAHGANYGAHCSKCDVDADRAALEKNVRDGTVMRCDKVVDGEPCNAPIKPKITFFGEKLPDSFINVLTNIQNDQIDLMIVIGTALDVGPFNTVVDKVACPQVLINLENTKESGFDFDNKEKYPGRIFMQGKCDETVLAICRHCGWLDELRDRCKGEEHLTKLMDNLTLADDNEEVKSGDVFVASNEQEGASSNEENQKEIANIIGKLEEGIGAPIDEKTPVPFVQPDTKQRRNSLPSADTQEQDEKKLASIKEVKEEEKE